MTKQHNFTRRALLAGSAAIVSSTALAGAVAPALSATPAQTPQERFDAALAELEAAYRAMRPDVGVFSKVDSEYGLAVVATPLVPPKPKPVVWDGPGAYEIVQGKACPVWVITREPSQDQPGERWFRLSTGFGGAHEPRDWFCPERNLPAITHKLRAVV